ncbi:guanine deaminase [Phyllosticta capitalensis]
MMPACALAEKTVYVGTFVHSKSLQELDICERGVIGVDETGKIAFIERHTVDLETILKEHEGWSGAKVVKGHENGFFFPGFIDTHIHAPQYPNAGIFGKSTLLDWLNTYTFPTESAFSLLSKARPIYNRVVRRTLSHGTTTAAYYATIHVASTNLLASICLINGQRAFIGRVCMDSDLSPPTYRDASAADSVSSTVAVINHIRQLDPHGTLVAPIITPRFAPSCTSHALSLLGALQREHDLLAQTHISENPSEVALVKAMFPSAKSYADVYDAAGLLNSKTILAHAIHLTADETALVRARGAKISHCPASNSALTSGVAPVRALLDEGIDVGLGTDVSGGYSPSVLEAARQAVLDQAERAKLSTEEALFLATRGGAQVVGLADRVGAFEVGMEWDAQMVGLGPLTTSSAEVEASPVDIFGWETWPERVDKWVFNGDDRNTLAVWVKGRLVHKREGVEL